MDTEVDHEVDHDAEVERETQRRIEVRRNLPLLIMLAALAVLFVVAMSFSLEAAHQASVAAHPSSTAPISHGA